MPFHQSPGPSVLTARASFPCDMGRGFLFFSLALAAYPGSEHGCSRCAVCLVERARNTVFRSRDGFLLDKIGRRVLVTPSECLMGETFTVRSCHG